MPHRTVLHVTHAPHSGAPRVAADLVADQIARGWRVVVACPPESTLTAWAREAGAEVRPWLAERAAGRSTPGEIVRLARIVAAIAPDVVHLHSSKAGLAGRLAVRGRRVTFLHPHAWSFQAEGRAGRAARWWEVLAMRWTDAALCVSDDERRVAIEAGLRGRLVVVRNGLDLGRWTAQDDASRLAARARLGLSDAPLAVCVGRLNPQKHQAALLDAWPAVRDRVPDAEAALVGDGPDREELEARGVPGVTFAGQTDAVRDWLTAADVVVMPSRYEGLSLALLEAMASARTVVATDVVGMRETLEPGAGAVVPPGAPDALARAVTARLIDPALARREGEAGRARVEERYDLRVVAARVADEYDAALARRR